MPVGNSMITLLDDVYKSRISHYVIYDWNQNHELVVCILINFIFQKDWRLLIKKFYTRKIHNLSQVILYSKKEKPRGLSFFTCVPNHADPYPRFWKGSGMQTDKRIIKKIILLILLIFSLFFLHAPKSGGTVSSKFDILYVI